MKQFTLNAPQAAKDKAKQGHLIVNNFLQTGTVSAMTDSILTGFSAKAQTYSTAKSKPATKTAKPKPVSTRDKLPTDLEEATMQLVKRMLCVKRIPAAVEKTPEERSVTNPDKMERLVSSRDETLTDGVLRSTQQSKINSVSSLPSTGKCKSRLGHRDSDLIL